MAHARHFRNSLPDFFPPSGAGVDHQPISSSISTVSTISTVSREKLLNLFQETFTAVRGYRTSNPTIYTGSAGVAYAMWHARRALRRLCPHHLEIGTANPAAAAATAAAPAGPAYAVPSDLLAALLATALEHAQAAVQALTGPKGLGVTRGSRSASMLDGGAGVHLTAALVLHDMMEAEAGMAGATGPGAAALPSAATGAAALLRERDGHVRAFLEAYPAAMDSENDEYLYGRAGYLQGAMLLNAQLGEGTVPEEVVEGVATEMLESGREMAGRLRWRRTDTPPPPLFYMWPHREQGDPYLGSAHGLMGILFVLMHCRPVVQRHPDELRSSLTYVASHETDAAGCTATGGHYPTRMTVTPPEPPEPGSKGLVHWCHGSPGAVFMWCKAYQVFGDASHLAAAERAGEVVWQLGLLRKGHGLCHGTSGNAYALLALHRATGNPRWLHRALQFGEHIGSREGRSVYDTPDRPLSLYEGRAGAMCLLADLLLETGGGDGGARFPVFELP